ncbi:MAG: TIGR03905 family TSCPD domain-containing protein [Acutalibacteraceae bacterium]|nr:TIGR03905 family TSCPD domain-containing protein [Acutalibacteraceae bacterium]
MIYKTTGVCARTIDIEMDGTKVKSVSFNGGCNGNGKGIGALVSGMEASEVINRCKGIKCGMKSTSCPDQLARALEKYLKEN